MRQVPLLTCVLSALTGLVYLASAAVPATKGKAPAPPAKATAAKSKQKQPEVAAKSKAGVPVAGNNKKSKAGASKSGGATAASNHSKAVYSRSARATQTARRGVPTGRPQSVWQTRPTPDRYREIQQALAEKGFFNGDVNGTWSTDSVQALKNFQRAENLEPDGKLGSLSLIALGLGPKRIATATQVPPPPPQTPPPSTIPENPNRQP